MSAGLNLTLLTASANYGTLIVDVQFSSGFEVASKTRALERTAVVVPGRDFILAMERIDPYGLGRAVQLASKAGLAVFEVRDIGLSGLFVEPQYVFGTTLHTSVATVAFFGINGLDHG